MHYGRVAQHEIEGIDFRLPPDTLLTQQTFQSAPRGGKPQVFVGCPVWGSKHWIGKMYPAKARDADFLEHYAQHFNTIELNATHYKIYEAPAIARWTSKVKDRPFCFCPKIPQAISHYSNLASQQASDLTDQFLNSISGFGEHLGPVFMQLSEHFSPAAGSSLFDYLQSWPRDLPLFVEVRHPDWFRMRTARIGFFQQLHALKLGAVLTDTSGRRDAVHMELPIPKAFVRFVSNPDHPSNYPRLDEWVQRIRRWIDSGLQELYFFLHYPDDVLLPELGDYFVEQLNRHCGTQLTRPLFISGEQAIQQSLF